MRVLNAAQMREADRLTIEEIGIPSLVLMENAGRQVVAAMEASFDDLADSHVAILSGRGNNGGDGFVVARVFQQRGIDASVFVVGRIADVRGDARTNLEILGRLGMSVVEIGDEEAWELHSSEVSGADVIVDALFGTGLSAPLSGLMQTIVADINNVGIPIVSVDLPSGLSADTPDFIGDCVDATLTVTLGAPKLPLVLPPGELRTGKLVIADIGIPADVIDQVSGPRLELLTRESMRALVHPREPGSHKGDFGHVLVVAGSRGKTGAAHLTAMAALRSGAGLVTVATPASCQPIVAAMAPEYMTVGLDESADGTVDFGALDLILARNDTVVAVGPGLGRSPSTTAFVVGLVERATVPLILDADALNALAEDSNRLMGRDDVPIIVTPHPGEMARLIGASVEDVQRDRLGTAREFAVRHKVVVVLKGHRTIIAMPDGTAFINHTGNPGMATGGTGDVLTGVLAGWLAQLLDAEAACKLAVYLHGAAGDLAEADDGEVALTAGDLLTHLGDAVMELTARRQVES